MHTGLVLGKARELLGAFLRLGKPKGPLGRGPALPWFPGAVSLDSEGFPAGVPWGPRT